MASAKVPGSSSHRRFGPIAKLLPVIGRHTQHFTDDVDGQPAGYRRDEVAAAGGYVRLDQRGRDLVNARFQRCDAARCEGTVDSAPDAVVVWRVEEQHHRLREHAGREGLRIPQDRACGFVVRNHERHW
jgi:hypothetical protein